jgi:diguanylate cyclase (GGDEF)-like protein/PAS domain S-box-containing protein
MYFLNTIPDAAILVDDGGQVAFANLLFRSMFEAGPSSLIGKSVSCFVPPGMKAHHDALMQQYANSPVVRPVAESQALSAYRTGGKQFPVAIMLSPVTLEQRSYTLCVVRDLSREKQQERRLQEALEKEITLANTDALTGAANGRCLKQLLEREIQRCRRHGNPFTLSYIDLDHFKKVNDQFGHAEGDKLLHHVAAGIQQRLRANDVLARMGGDEFVILLPDTKLSESKTVLANLMQRLKALMQANDWPVTFSCGTVAFLKSPIGVDEALRAADHLMYQAKADRNACHFDTYMGESAPEHLSAVPR